MYNNEWKLKRERELWQAFGTYEDVRPYFTKNRLFDNIKREPQQKYTLQDFQDLIDQVDKEYANRISNMTQSPIKYVSPLIMKHLREILGSDYKDANPRLTFRRKINNSEDDFSVELTWIITVSDIKYKMIIDSKIKSLVYDCEIKVAEPPKEPIPEYEEVDMF